MGTKKEKERPNLDYEWIVDGDKKYRDSPSRIDEFFDMFLADWRESWAPRSVSSSKGEL